MLARKDLLFETALHTVKTNRKMMSAITTRGSQVIETNIIVQQHKVNTSLENLKEDLFTNISKLVPLASMTIIHPIIRKLFTEEIPNVPLPGRLSQFVKQRKKYTRQRNFVNNEGVSDIIHKSPNTGEASKQNKNVRTTNFASVD